MISKDWENVLFVLPGWRKTDVDKEASKLRQEENAW